MAKASGIGFALAIDDSSGTPRTITNDIQNLTISTPRNLQDVTGLDKSAREQLPLLGDVATSYNGTFNDASNMGHDVFKTVSSTTVIRTCTHTIDSKVLAAELYLTDYNLTRAADGSFTYAVPGVLGDGAAPTWA